MKEIKNLAGIYPENLEKDLISSEGDNRLKTRGEYYKSIHSRIELMRYRAQQEQHFLGEIDNTCYNLQLLLDCERAGDSENRLSFDELESLNEDLEGLSNQFVYLTSPLWTNQGFYPLSLCDCLTTETSKVKKHIPGKIKKSVQFKLRKTPFVQKD